MISNLRYPTILVLPLSMLLLSACQEVPKDSSASVRPAISATRFSIPVAYCGETLRFTIHCQRKDFAVAKSAEVLLENAVPNVLEDSFIDSAKCTVPLKTKDTSMIAEFPTTADFKPGIWHIKQITLTMPDKKQIKLDEGKDFSGLPLELNNGQRLPGSPPELQIVSVESKPQ